MDYFGYDISDWIPCEIPKCGHQVVDIHHIDPRGMGGSKEKDHIENLAGLCRQDHEKAESDPEFNEYVKEVHLSKVKEHEAK